MRLVNLVNMRHKNIIKVLSGSHAMEILKELNKSSSRFVDMESFCPSKRTRYVRLKELEEIGLIRPVPKMIAHKSYTYYEVTDKGLKALKIGEKLLSINGHDNSGN